MITNKNNVSEKEILEDNDEDVDINDIDDDDFDIEDDDNLDK